MWLHTKNPTFPWHSVTLGRCSYSYPLPLPSTFLALEEMLKGSSDLCVSLNEGSVITGQSQESMELTYCLWSWPLRNCTHLLRIRRGSLMHNHMTQIATLVRNRWHFPGFTFKLKFDNWDNTVSTLGKVSSNVLPITRISSRYTNRIWKFRSECLVH